MFLATLTYFNAVRDFFRHINNINIDFMHSIINKLSSLNNVPDRSSFSVFFKGMICRISGKSDNILATLLMCAWNTKTFYSIFL